MNILENLELVEVTIENGKAVLTFLDEHNGEIREVNFNKNVYDSDSNKFVPDADKAIKVEEWCQQFFQVTFNDLPLAVGDRKDVYCYDKFNSLFEVQMVAKMGEDMVGQILSVEVAEVLDNGNAVQIRFEYDGETYESKMGYSTYLEVKKEWFVNPQKQQKQYAKFEEKFHIHIDNKEELVGKTIMVEVKKAMGKYIYNEIKPKKKKKK